MKTIHKFNLVKDSTKGELTLHEGALFLGAATQYEDSGEMYPVLWFEVNTEAQKEKRLFKMFNSGAELPNKCGHLKTFFQKTEMGMFCHHLYEIKD